MAASSSRLSRHVTRCGDVVWRLAAKEGVNRTNAVMCPKMVKVAKACLPDRGYSSAKLSWMKSSRQASVAILAVCY